MPHLVACRTRGVHRDGDRAADGAAEDVRNHPHNRSAHRHSPSAHRLSAILDEPQRVAAARRLVMRGEHQRGAAARARDPCVPPMRSAPERPV